MSLLISGDEYTSTGPAPEGATAPGGADPSIGTGEDAGARAADHNLTVTIVTNPMLANPILANPMLAPTVRQSAILVPAPDAGAVPNGARLVRVGNDQAFPIRDGTAMIGRDRESDLVVSGPAVSRRHSIVRRSMRGYVVTDLSRNGIYVNGRRVRGSRRLRTGDVLRIGDEEFRFEMTCATPCGSIALPGALTQRLRRLRAAVPVRDLSRRLAAMPTAWTSVLLPRLTRASRVAGIAARRAFWTIRARVTLAWSARRRPS